MKILRDCLIIVTGIVSLPQIRSCHGIEDGFIGHASEPDAFGAQDAQVAISGTLFTEELSQVSEVQQKIFQIHPFVTLRR